jgi:hypothetical protein
MMQFKAYGQAIIKTHLKITKVVDGDGIFVMNIFNKQEEEIRFLGRLSACLRLVSVVFSIRSPSALCIALLGALHFSPDLFLA